MINRDISQPPLMDHLVKAHGPSVKPVIMRLRTEIGVLDGMPHPLTIKDALVQHMTWRLGTDIKTLGQVFDLRGYPPLRYFRDVLTETPGLEELARDFEKKLVEAAKADPTNRALRTAKQVWVLD